MLFGEADVWLCTTVASMWTLWSAVSVMVNESVEAHASEYQSQSRHRYILCKGLEMIREKRELVGRDKEIALGAYCVSTMCGVYSVSVKWTNAEYASVAAMMILSLLDNPLLGLCDGAYNKEGKCLKVIFPSDMRSYCIAFLYGSNVTMLVIVAYLGIVELQDFVLDKYWCFENAGVV
ncbi:hypothetical protein Syun_004763 [Stephania yunnanensis]|uniref:Uncharacterized protein n=1 Tax=Stephania yunnanensis TaxID=152371 RepID=A0AAP0L433_9MAGN